MRKLPPLNALRAFESAARHLSFQLAAAELGVTPTAISHQIRLLEETCGQTLFRRRPRPMRLTPAGEQLFPVLSRGFDTFALAVENLSAAGSNPALRVTTPNFFASRWLVPRLSNWRALHPEIALEVIGSDHVLSLANGEADVAIRYARNTPTAVAVQELFRDSYSPVCRSELLPGGKPFTNPTDICQLPRIHYDWRKADAETPTWRRWWTKIRETHPDLPTEVDICQLSFHEEANAFAAVLAGLGVAICSDLMIAQELERGELVKAHALSLPGQGYFLVYLPGHPRELVIALFADWLRNVV